MEINENKNKIVRGWVKTAKYTILGIPGLMYK